MTLLVWAWLATVPGLLLTAAGLGRRWPGIASVPGPLLMGMAGLAWAWSDRTPVDWRAEGWLPGLPDAAFALHLDGLAAAMLSVVGCVSACVYVYSLGYMRGDPGQRRFFVLLDCFLLAMGLLALAGTLPMLLIGWTGVGLVSYLLIAFWRDRPGTLRAGLEAVAANAVGDAALLLAVVLLPAGAGDLGALAGVVGGERTPPGGPTLFASLLLVAACAKSAQGPLFFWLPSAMAGPTPVSALIHAATMVAAGVYLLARAAPVFALAPAVRDVTAWVGTGTAVLAAVASLQQRNLKRGLAYSTVSQLGVMFAAAGFGAPLAAMFHLVTHAAFKALLFLAAGVVIHATDGEEELTRLGGLRRALPGAALAFLIGCLCLIGVPAVTSGAFSKDAILEAGLARAPVLGWLLLLSVFLTGLYAGRLYFAVFGAARPVATRAHAEGRLLLLPLLPLGVAALTLGFLVWPRDTLTPLLALAPSEPLPHHLVTPSGVLAAGLGLAGFALAALWTRRRADARLPAAAVDWVAAVPAAGLAAAARLAAVHDGRLGRSVLVGVVGVAIVVYLAAGHQF
jgi:NADH-quinone oxidoreductase subunit L